MYVIPIYLIKRRMCMIPIYLIKRRMCVILIHLIKRRMCVILIYLMKCLRCSTSSLIRQGRELNIAAGYIILRAIISSRIRFPRFTIRPSRRIIETYLRT